MTLPFLAAYYDVTLQYFFTCVVLCPYVHYYELKQRGQIASITTGGA